MNRAINLTCAVLFAGTTLCALVLSASSTIAKAEAVGVPGGAVWSAVGVLELVSLAGTLRWLVATTARGRLHAVLVVGAVAVVTGFAGWASFGWFGLVAPAAVVATIHMVVETLADLPGRRDPEPRPGPEWGPPSAVTEPPVTEPVPVTAPVRDLHPVPTGKRTRRELVAAGAPLGVKRRANELLDDFQARVEQAERAQRGAA